MYILILLLLSYLIQSTKIELYSDDFSDKEQYLGPKTEDVLSESSKVLTTIDDNQEFLWIVLKFLAAGNAVLLAIYFSM